MVNSHHRIKLDRKKVEERYPETIGKFVIYDALSYNEGPFRIIGINPNINADWIIDDLTEDDARLLT